MEMVNLLTYLGFQQKSLNGSGSLKRRFKNR